MLLGAALANRAIRERVMGIESAHFAARSGRFAEETTTASLRSVIDDPSKVAAWFRERGHDMPEGILEGLIEYVEQAAARVKRIETLERELAREKVGGYPCVP